MEGRKKQFDKLDERHSELLSLLLQSIGEEVGLEKASEDASSPLQLVKKVKQLLRINDISTKRDIERKWHQTLNQDLRKPRTSRDITQLGVNGPIRL